MLQEARKRILIVEDDPDLLETLERQFADRAGDCEVTGVRDGVSALQVAHVLHPDVILLDLFIPQLKGLDMLRALRASDWGKNVNVIVLTNFDESGFLQEAIALGAADFLVKAHYSLEQVVERVRAVLRESVPEPSK